MPNGIKNRPNGTFDFTVKAENSAGDDTKALTTVIDGDGRVDANDLLLILRYLAGDPSIDL